MDQADHYLQLALLGFDAFVASAAPAALVRARPGETLLPDDDSRDSSVDLENETMVGSEVGGKRRSRLEIYPLIKKAGASFPDMITVGRTPNNDIVLRDATVSRLHAYFKNGKPPSDKRWLVADGGSKNGTMLDGVALEPRREREVDNGQIVKIGDLELTFYTAAHLFHVLGA